MIDQNENSLKAGDKVGHPRRPDWGRGEIISLEANDRVKVLFSAVGMKTISLKHVPLVPLNANNPLSNSSAVLQQFNVRKLGSPRLKGFREEFVHSYVPASKRMFQKGELIREWMDRFPGTFDQDDEETAIQSFSPHIFKQWLGALLYRRKFNCSCLLSGYLLNSHREKQKTLRQILNIPTHTALKELVEKYPNSLFPDLLLWSSLGSKPFFAVIREGNAPLEKGREELLQTLKEKTGLSISLLSLQVDSEMM